MSEFSRLAFARVHSQLLADLAPMPCYARPAVAVLGLFWFFERGMRQDMVEKKPGDCVNRGGAGIDFKSLLVRKFRYIATNRDRECGKMRKEECKTEERANLSVYIYTDSVIES